MTLFRRIHAHPPSSEIELAASHVVARDEETEIVLHVEVAQRSATPLLSCVGQSLKNSMHPLSTFPHVWWHPLATESAVEKYHMNA